MGSPYRLFRGYFCVTIEIAARLDGRSFIRFVRGIHSIDSHAAEVDESLGTGIARNIEDVLRALTVGSKEFIPASGLPDQGGAMKYEIASFNGFKQRAQVKQICLKNFQWKFPQPFRLLRVSNHSADVDSLFRGKPFHQTAPDETGSACHECSESADLHSISPADPDKIHS